LYSGPFNPALPGDPTQALTVAFDLSALWSEMAALWVGLFAVAALSLVWVCRVKPAMQLARPWRVQSVVTKGLATWELTLTPTAMTGCGVDAGQFARINIGHSPSSLNENPFSISSAPGAGPDLRFAIKELGDFTDHIGAVAPGTCASVDGPFGHLTIAGRDAPGITLIAGAVRPAAHACLG
jgi:predicted ferric reductase